MTDDAEAADGLAAAAFAAAWARWERVSAADSPTEYLWVLLMRQATMDDRDTGGRGPRDQAKRPEHRGVRQALALLPVRRRACVVLRYAFGLPEAEIARMVGISVAGVTSELSKGGAELERALGTPPGGAEPATGWFETGDGAPAGDAGSAERLRTSLSEEAARIEPSHDRIRGVEILGGHQQVQVAHRTGGRVGVDELGQGGALEGDHRDVRPVERGQELPQPVRAAKTGHGVRLKDLMSAAAYERAGSDLLSGGLYLDMPAWGYHVFELGVW